MPTLVLDRESVAWRILVRWENHNRDRPGRNPFEFESPGSVELQERSVVPVGTTDRNGESAGYNLRVRAHHATRQGAAGFNMDFADVGRDSNVGRLNPLRDHGPVARHASNFCVNPEFGFREDVTESKIALCVGACRQPLSRIALKVFIDVL